MEEHIGIRISRLREALGMSRAELHRLSGYKQYSNLFRVEREGIVPGGKQLTRIAQALGTTEQYLLRGDDSARHMDKDEWLAQLPSPNPVAQEIAKHAWDVSQSSIPPPMPTAKHKKRTKKHKERT